MSRKRLGPSIDMAAAENEVRAIWKMADAVCFDVDSTVIQEEAIDELAKFCGKGEEVKKLTREAMGGKMAFQDAFSKRLQIIRPKMSQIRDFIRNKPPRLTPGIKRLVEVLHQRSVPIYLISGGLMGVITPVALELNIPLQNIFANRLKFFFNEQAASTYLLPMTYGVGETTIERYSEIARQDCYFASASYSTNGTRNKEILQVDWEYAGFDDSEPTSRSGGKGEVIRMLKEKHGYGHVVIIGDGITDLEASPPADAFIGYGGNVIREEVKARAKWFVTDFNELIEAL